MRQIDPSTVTVTIYPQGRDALWRWEHHADRALACLRMSLPRRAEMHAALARASRDAFLGGK